MCRENLNDLLQRLPPPAKVMSAELTADFTIQGSAAGEQSREMGPTTVTVCLTDERGKKWIGVNSVPRPLGAALSRSNLKLKLLKRTETTLTQG